MSETFSFQSDISRLLELLSHSLYQNTEIALRELVSNASDALDKRRYVGLTDEAVRTDEELTVSLNPDEESKTLTISDNGIGMSHDDLVNNLGTIAKSGTLEFAKQALEAKKEADAAGGDDVSLIGQFGVGFYSSFMLADTVEVVTKKAGEDQAYRWTSTGTGEFSIEEAEKESAGTDIILKLKDDAEEFSKADRVTGIVKKYSTFIPHPVKVGDEVASDQRPIWVEPKSQVSDEQYNEFYKHISGYPMDPLWHLHLTFDSPLQVASILYCPVSNMETMGFGKYEQGLSLCAKRVLVQDDCRKLLPEYLRFVAGLVDSDDLPLNVSREALQDSTVFAKIQKVLVKKILDYLDSLSSDDADKYDRFYAQFGSILREGINDFQHKERVAKLLRYTSTNDGEKKTSLAEYCDRLKPEQDQIYFAGGSSRAAVLANPHVTAITGADCEVLVLLDPVDEFALAQLGEFDGKKLVPVDSDDVKLPGESDDDDKEPETPAGFDAVIRDFRESLGDTVEDVRASSRLKEAPSALVNPKGQMSTQMQKVMAAHEDGFNIAPRILELNPSHPLVERLCQIVGNEQHKGFVELAGRKLYQMAAIADGLPFDVAVDAKDTATMLEELAQSKSAIVT